MPEDQQPDDFNILIEVARLYYEQQLTQAEIGQRISVSRSTVSRLLQEARDQGVVTIIINYTVARDANLEKQLQITFGLKKARVLCSNGQPRDVVRKGMGQLAARLLEKLIDNDLILGVSYGRSIADTVAQVRPSHHENVTVVPVIGALGSDNPLIEGIDLTRELATKFGAKYRYLHAPLLVENARMRDLLVQEPTVQEVLSLGNQSDIALFEIGALASDTSGLIWAGYLNRKDLSWLQNKGVVGHMCAQFFDAEGQLVDIDLNHRAISIGLPNLRNIETVIAVAGSEQKAEAILGALHGGYVDILVTDDAAANRILALEQCE